MHVFVGDLVKPIEEERPTAMERSAIRGIPGSIVQPLFVQWRYPLTPNLFE